MNINETHNDGSLADNIGYIDFYRKKNSNFST